VLCFNNMCVGLVNIYMYDLVTGVFLFVLQFVLIDLNVFLMITK